MKKLIYFSILMLFTVTLLTSCDSSTRKRNVTALQEQNKTEVNQAQLNEIQLAPLINWSLERDNLIKRFKLQNDRSISFFMYVFIEGVSDPIGYYQVNKISSVNSQLTNTEQLVEYHVSGVGIEVCELPSPAEDGSYGTNGDAIFGFTPEGIYIETNMKYITSTVPLTFTKPVNRLAIINTEQAQAMLELSKKAMQ